MFKKNGQFSVEFLLIFVFIMSVVSIIIVVLGNISLDISLDEKRKEVDDFANSIIMEFEIMQSVDGGYVRDFYIDRYFMDRFNVAFDDGYLVVSDSFTYGDQLSGFQRYYQIPGNPIFTTRIDNDGNMILTFCKNYNYVNERIDYMGSSEINDLFCVDEFSKNWNLIYDLDIPASGSDWNTKSDVNYVVENDGLTINYSRVAYLFELDDYYVWAEMADFTNENLIRTGLPVDWDFQIPVENLTIYSNHFDVENIFNSNGGFIEFWSNCYTPVNTYYDNSDTPTTEDCYGSFQLFNENKTVFAYNRWSSGGNDDLGIGENRFLTMHATNPTIHPDWTYTYTSNSFEKRRLRIFVK